MAAESVGTRPACCLVAAGRLKFQRPRTDVGLMTAVKVIEEMDNLPPDEQAKVIWHAFELARHRQLSADELGDLS